jgi:DNA-binding Lrp family transcriptional regulator
MSHGTGECGGLIMRAFVEVVVKAGKVKHVMAELRRMRDAVELVCPVTGHCDIMVIVDLPNLDSFSEFLLEKVQRLDGVARTESLVCITDDRCKR